MKAKVTRIPGRLVTAANRVARTFNARADKERTFYIKNMNGIISDKARDVFIDLVAMENVPANRVTSVFKCSASMFGIEVEGEVSDRSIGQILKEGGNTSKLQFVSALGDAKVTVKQGVTISGDGTTHKNETYELKFATVITPEKRIQFFLGIKMAVNHTSETQLTSWIESIEEFFNLAYDSKLVSVNDTRIFWNLKKQLDCETRGERTIQGLSDNEYACLVFQGSQLLVQNSGGPASWERLTLKERTCRIADMKKQLARDIGEVEFQKLSASEQSEIDLFLWAGCCMHKEMNAFKGGCIGLDDFWDEHTELTSPIPLPNRDNAATIRLASGTAAAARVKGRTERDLFIEFLTYVRYNKGSGALNHMEQNVLNGLQDIATRHELCTITLYWLSISIPYMHEVRGPNAKQDNILKLESLHRRVIEHIDTLIEYPEYVIGPDASYAKGSLDGMNWEHPDAFYAVQSYAPGLLHLKVIFVYFLKKSRVVWLHFMSEFEEGSALSLATPEQIDCAFMEKMNNLNESAFGIYRQSSCHNPTMSITQHNSQQMVENQQILNERRQAASQAIDNIIPILTLTTFGYLSSLPQGSKEYLSVGELMKQLKWHKKNGRKGSVPLVESSWGKREDKIKLLRSVIEEHITHEASQTGLRDIPEEGEPNEEIPNITPEDLECFQEDGYNSEEEFYGQ
ncbi:hypothetical protein EV360DRAFT_85587 [Lentinula raphanica]|nr:hypothetical protein EV360DRAFT_85587 [Lentinula raphanica]